MAGRLLRVGEPEGPTDLFIPLKQLFVVQGPDAVNAATLKDIGELPTLAGGRSAKPRQPFAFHGADGSASMVVGAGVTEAAELQDLAYAQHEKQVARANETREERRARLGLPAPWTQAEVSEYFENKVKYFKAHQVTDNGQPEYETRLY